jgi:FtsP/CotA-like multicopper oxidase with cupredoxin domain
VDGVPGEVKVLIDFRDPIIVGKFVAHCHIGAHEDNGMMAVVEVVQE